MVVGGGGGIQTNVCLDHPSNCYCCLTSPFFTKKNGIVFHFRRFDRTTRNIPGSAPECGHHEMQQFLPLDVTFKMRKKVLLGVSEGYPSKVCEYLFL